ncbi:unnamed protein product [Blumeria hordei]|uniref:protein-tyrosine-phosphatase n=1 Tax=Blumeria hordei TaxID=2867405 RepID=A0A383UWY1_BLUHO|nr:unnamed protein product [Blumeria hordei]
MSSASTLPSANSRTLKRSYTSVAVSSPSSPDRSIPIRTSKAPNRRLVQSINTSPRIASDSSPYVAWGNTESASSKMYQRYSPPSASFFMVYNIDSSSMDGESRHINTNPSHSSTKVAHACTLLRQSSLVTHGDQNTTYKTEPDSLSHSYHYLPSLSTEPSPTTTVSTMDSSSMSDPSPCTPSAVSPNTIISTSSLTDNKFGSEAETGPKLVIQTPPQLSLNDDCPIPSPNPRKKNLKSLALNLSPSMGGLMTPELSSPSFIKPPTLKGKKKPSLLSLNTGAANNLTLDPPNSPRYSTMLHRRSLKHSISTPQILATPAFGPAGGMTLRSSPVSSCPRDSSLVPRTLGNYSINEAIPESRTGTQMATRVPGATVGGDSFDRPHSGEDAQSPAYPDGPILMHEPSVYLYSEPTQEEASKFDVVINVAKEVKCPFSSFGREECKVPHLSNLDASLYRFTSEAPETAKAESTDINNEPAQSYLASNTAPSRQNLGTMKISEYLHIPWDHNTDVKDDLWDLCELIEARTKAGKRVLIHCQQGASRSATLIIAYGMFIDQKLGPNESYQKCQAKSRWVNPNMSLLFSLNDFKKVIDQKKTEKNSIVRPGAAKHRTSLAGSVPDLPTTMSRRNSTPTTLAWEKPVPHSRKDDMPIPASAIEIDSTISRLGAFDFGVLDLATQPRDRHMENHHVSILTDYTQPLGEITSYMCS